MFKNYMKIALRNLRKRKGFAFINIAGLGIGMACSVLILLYVQHELSYDLFHEHADDIYRVERDVTFHQERGVYPVTAHPYAPALEAEFPEIATTTRIWTTNTDFLDKKQQYNRARLFYADSSFFDVFTFSLLHGDKATALREPFSVVLTESQAKRYFPERDPIGQTLTMQWGKDYDMKVTGVIADVPENSHMHFDAIASYSTVYSIFGQQSMNVWFSNNIYTYLRLQPGSNPATLEAKLPAWQEKYMGNRARELMGHGVDITKIVQLKLKPMTDIHLYSNLEHEIEPNSDITTVYIFSAVALLILLIACINFMNLSTARSMDRAKEVGLRKVVGAERARLIAQFLCESVIMAFLALLLAVGLIELLLPVFGSLTGKTLEMHYLNNPTGLLALVALAAFVGVISGSYPAFFLSGFRPIAVLKGKFAGNKQGVLLRKILVVMQFAISIALIIGTVVVMQQLDFLRSKQLGFDKEHTVIIPINDANLKPSHIEAVKQEIGKNPAVVSVATGNKVPGDRQFSDTMFRKDNTGQHAEDMVNMQYYFVSHDYLSTLGVEMAAGRSFSREFSTDASSAYILNEAAVRKLNWGSPEEAVGRKFARVTGTEPKMTFKDGQIIGVVKDFHFKSLHQKIEPIVLELSSGAYNYVLARIRPENIPQTLEFLQETMRRFSPNYPFDYFFQDAYFESLYRSEERMRQIFGYFTFLAIFIACLGLFGLASFSAEQRTKEVGIRKVLGATVTSIVGLLSKDFLRLVLVAFVVAAPVAYLAMNRWLADFAYRIDIGWWVFLLAGGLAFVIAVLTVSTQAVRSAMTNPADSLRYE